MVGAGVYELTHDKDLKLSSGVKSKIIRDYGTEKSPHNFFRLWTNPKLNSPEGLGVDHEEWQKQKMEAQQK